MGKIENDARLGIYLKTMLDWILQLKTMLDGSLAVIINIIVLTCLYVHVCALRLRNVYIKV